MSYVSEPWSAFQFRYPGSGHTCGSAEAKTEEPFRSLPYPSCPPLLHSPPTPKHPWPLHGIVALLRLTCDPPPSLLGVCMQSLHPADPGGGASLPSNGCGAPGPEGEWRVSRCCPLRIFCYMFVVGGWGALRVSYLCSLLMCKWNAACYIRRENVTRQSLWLLKGLGSSDSGSSKNADILSVTPHNAIQTQQTQRRSC